MTSIDRSVVVWSDLHTRFARSSAMIVNARHFHV